MRLTLAIIASLGLALSGCQSSQRAAGEPIAGNWAADDGSFIATFNEGVFSSRLIATGETVIAGGRYERSADGLTLTWTSLAANEPRAANCTFVDTNRVACAPSVGQQFTMTRVA